MLSSVSYVQPANVQHLTLTGSANLTATALNANSTITRPIAAPTPSSTPAGSVAWWAEPEPTPSSSTPRTASTRSPSKPRRTPSCNWARYLNLSDLTATRSGNDLLLGAGEHGGLLLQNYFLDPGAWTLQDAAGAPASIPALIAATARAKPKPTNSPTWKTNSLAIPDRRRPTVATIAVRNSNRPIPGVTARKIPPRPSGP